MEEQQNQQQNHDLDDDEDWYDAVSDLPEDSEPKIVNQSKSDKYVLVTPLNKAETEKRKDYVDNDMSGIGILGTDLLASVLSFLSWKEVLCVRVCQKWKEAALAAPLTEIFVNKRKIGLKLDWISRVLPRTQKLRFDQSLSASEEFHFAAGENAGLSVLSITSIPSSVDLRPIENFSNLRHLVLHQTNLNGSYPFLFQFHNLESLDLTWNRRLKWDLSMLAVSPNLKILFCVNNESLTGTLDNLRVLRRTLKVLNLSGCKEVTGSLNDLFDFPVLEKVNLSGTKVTGDIRHITSSDFVSIKELNVGHGVYGGEDTFSRIDAATEFMLVKSIFLKRLPNLFDSRRWHLAYDSPDRYDFHGHHSREPPFWVEFVRAGPRRGWRWTNAVHGGSCEIRWLDPELDQGDERYTDYIRDLENKNRDVGFYEGLTEPPTEQEHISRNNGTPLEPFLLRQSRGLW